MFTVFSCLPILVSIAYKFWNGRRRRTKSIRPQEQARSSKIDVLVNFIILDLQNWSAFLLRKIVFEFIFSECTKSQLMYHELSSKVMEIAHERMETIAKTFFSNCQSDKGQKIFKKGIFLPFNSSKKNKWKKIVLYPALALFFKNWSQETFILRFFNLCTAWSEFYKKKFEQCSTEISVSNSWISQNIEIIDEFAANNIGSNVSIDLQIGQMMEEVKLRSSQFAFLLAFLLGWQRLGSFKQSPNPPDPNVKGHNSSCCSIV